MTTQLVDCINTASLKERMATYHACWVVALTDGRLWREKQLLLRIADELKLERKLARTIEKDARRGKKDFDEPITDAGCQVMFHFSVNVAAADGRLSDKEREVTYRFGRQLGLSETWIDEELERLIPERYRPRTERVRRWRSLRRCSRLERRKTDGNGSSGSISSLVTGLRRDAVATDPLSQILENLLPFLLMIGANLIPVIGALFWEWDVATILFLYWAESSIIGFFTACRIRFSALSANPSSSNLLTFFCLHFGLFTAGHGLFLFAVFLDLKTASLTEVITSRGFLITLAVIIIEHALFFHTEFIRDEQYKRSKPDDHFVSPYPRILAMHVTIFAGAGTVHLFDMGRVVAVMILIGLHSAIETISWAYKLPSKGFLGGIRSAVLRGLMLAGIMFVFCVSFGGSCFGLLSITASALQQFAILPRWIQQLVTSVTLPFRVGLLALSSVFLAGLAGVIIGLLEYFEKMDFNELSSRTFGYVMLLVAGVSAMFSFLLPIGNLDDHEARTGTSAQVLDIAQPGRSIKQ